MQKTNLLFVENKPSWLNSHRYCEDTNNGNLASVGLETFAATDFNTQDDFSISIRKVNGAWIRVTSHHTSTYFKSN